MLELGTKVKINMETAKGSNSIEEANINAEGRIVGFADGRYQVLFFPEQGPLWFGRDELTLTGGNPVRPLGT